MPHTISELWTNNRAILEDKTLEQVLKFAGDGKLKDEGATSLEFRKFLSALPLSRLEEYINECLTTAFDDSGYALQDLVNELGKRLGFNVECGLYRGKKNRIGFDGFWTSSDNDIIIEVKTTDAYSINLDTISNYRNSLIEEKQTNVDRSSILLIVGRKDTGGLEAQIRGSKHAWDIRLISIDSLIKLIKLKEDLLDSERTFGMICKVLKPMEFTRLDYLIDTIFITGQEAQAIEDANIPDPEIEIEQTGRIEKAKAAPVNFNEKCAAILEKYLEAVLKKQTRTLFIDEGKRLGLTCAVSKNHGTDENGKYWFAFHAYQKESLARFENAYVSFGCGDESTLFIFEYKRFIGLLDKMRTTENSSRMYWHVEIKHIGNKFFLLRGEKDHVDITKNKVPVTT